MTPSTCRNSRKERQAYLLRSIVSLNLHTAIILQMRKLRHKFL